MLDQVLKKLNVNDRELKLFDQLKNNYYIKDTLFIKDDKKYTLTITYNVNNISHLFGEPIKDRELFYTLKQGNKIIFKNESKKNAITRITYLLKD